MAFTWSPQQQAIFAQVRKNDRRNIVVIARAGTGKTTTIVKAVDFAPEKKILFAAFNVKIKQALIAKVRNPNVKVNTIHGLGFAFVMRNWTDVQVDKEGTRADTLSRAACGNVPDPIIRLVSRLHTKAREQYPYAKKYGDLTELLYSSDCEPEEGWQEQGYDAKYVEDKALQAMVLAAEKKPADLLIDFADMVFLPLRNGWVMRWYEMVVIDEFQDMTAAQLDLVMKACRGRIMLVGDDRQAIYAFRGADTTSATRLPEQLNAIILPLTVTYRCGKNITTFAQTLVPDITADERNPFGQINPLPDSKLIETAQHGDFILSRINAPLPKIAMALLKSGKRARIAGRDIGESLRNLLRKMSKGTDQVDRMLEQLNAWEVREVSKWTAAERPDRAASARDKAEMLRDLAEDTITLEEIGARINRLFTDDGLGDKGIITCSSVHKAKGLEADRVFILWDTLRGRNQEEENIKYVAITRAIEELVLVTKGGGGEEPLVSYSGGLGPEREVDYFLCSGAERLKLWAEAERYGRDS